jgi:hypothetical protein
MAICRFAADDRIRHMPHFGRTPRRDIQWLDIDMPARPLVVNDLKPIPAADRKPSLAAPGAPTGTPGASGPTEETALPFPPTHRVAGRVRFRYRGRSPDILSSHNNDDYPQYAGVYEMQIYTRTMRWASVVLQDDCGHYIKGQLDSQGEFRFDWIPVNCERGTITIWSVVHSGNRKAAVGRWVGGNISHVDQLTANTGDYRAFSITRSFSIADATIGSSGLYLDIVVSESDEAAKPFWLLENALDALLYFYQIPGVYLMPKLNVIYSPGLAVEQGDQAFYSPNKDPGFIYIPAAPTDYGWIGFAVRHEAAHCFHTHYLREHTYGRIGEPLANVHAQAMVGSPWMDKVNVFENLDVQANFTNSAFRLEDKDGKYWEYCEGCEWTASYGWVQRILWDLVDGGPGSAEPLTKYHPFGEEQLFEAGQFDMINGGGGTGQSTNGGDHALNDVLVHYLGGGVYGNENPDYVDRGFPKVDIVDVLDGMICRGHATMEQIDLLVNHAMMFGYVAKGPTACQ